MLAEEKERRQKVEDQIKTANYTQQLRDKAREAKDLEERRDALHNELAGLNAQANTRARLQLRRTERMRKDEAIASLIDKSAASFRKFAKADPQRESMEAQVSALVQCVPRPLLGDTRTDGPSRRTLDQDVTFAERASRDAARELQNIETSVSIAKKKIKDLKQAAEGEDVCSSLFPRLDLPVLRLQTPRPRLKTACAGSTRRKQLCRRRSRRRRKNSPR